MAVMTLHKPGTTLGPAEVGVGNYLDLSTEQVRILESDQREDFKLVLGNAPHGAVLATGVDGLPVHLAIEPGWRPPRDLSGSDFVEHRRQFDLMTFENAGGRGADKLDFESRNLAYFDLTVGTRMVLMFEDSRSGPRYFRVLVHGAIGDAGTETAPAFQGKRTVLQFEELVPHRIIVPLGIKDVGGGMIIATSEDIPAHFVNRDTSQLMWSIRPSQSSYIGSEIYDRPFPVAKVVFKQAVQGSEEAEVPILPHGPGWVGSATQRNIVSRSYMNSTYSIDIHHDGRPKNDPTSQKREDPYIGGEVMTHRYKYDLYLVDGTRMRFRKYDPPVDVEDED